MKKSALYFGAIITMFCAGSCSGDSSDSHPIEIDDQTAQTTDIIPTDEDQVASPEEIAFQTEAKPKSKVEVEKIIEDRIENDPATRSTNNTSSIYRYLTSNPEYSVIGLLIAGSSLTKDLHHNSHTMFAPLDSKWNQSDKKKALEWKRNGETDKIDAYLKNHIISIVVSAQKIQRTQSLDSEGKMVFIFDQENAEVNGVPFSTTDYSVGNGKVIALSGNFPL